MINDLSDHIQQITDQNQINQFIESSAHLQYLLSVNEESTLDHSLVIPHVERKPDSQINQLDLKILIKKKQGEYPNKSNTQLWLFRVEDFLRRQINIEELLYKIIDKEVRDIEEHIIQQIIFLTDPENASLPMVPQHIVKKSFYKKTKG